MFIPGCKLLHFDWNLIKICSQRSNWNVFNFGLGNGWVTSSYRPFIIGTNIDKSLMLYGVIWAQRVYCQNTDVIQTVKKISQTDSVWETRYLRMTLFNTFSITNMLRVKCAAQKGLAIARHWLNTWFCNCICRKTLLGCFCIKRDLYEDVFV